MSLGSFYFRGVYLDEYFRPEDMEQCEHYRGIIPERLIEADSFLVGSDTIYGFWALRPQDTLDVEPRPPVVTILYNQGNQDNINYYWDRVELLWEMGYRVYIYDYPGYGRSQGTSTGEGCFKAAIGALRQVRWNYVVDTNLVVYYGFSLGSYMATYLAADSISPAAVILESAPASTSALIHDSGLLDMPGGILSADDFDNEKHIGNIGCPLLMIHGVDDDYMVFERHAAVLWELAVQPKDSFWVQGAGHGDVPYVAGEEYADRIESFIEEYVE